MLPSLAKLAVSWAAPRRGVDIGVDEGDRKRRLEDVREDYYEALRNGKTPSPEWAVKKAFDDLPQDAKLLLKDEQGHYDEALRNGKMPSQEWVDSLQKRVTGLLKERDNDAAGAAGALLLRSLLRELTRLDMQMEEQDAAAMARNEPSEAAAAPAQPGAERLSSGDTGRWFAGDSSGGETQPGLVHTGTQPKPAAAETEPLGSPLDTQEGQGGTQPNERRASEDGGEASGGSGTPPLPMPP